MRAAQVSIAITLVSVLSAGSAMASSGKESFDLPSTSSLGGVELQAGKYTVEWTGTGESVEVTIRKGKKDLLTTQAKLREEKRPIARDSAVLARNEATGAHNLVEMLLGGTNVALNFEGATAKASSGAAVSEQAKKR